MQPDLFSGADELATLHAECERYRGVIRLLEESWSESERQANRLSLVLLNICRNEEYQRCGVVEHCNSCPIMASLEAAGVWSPKMKAEHEREVMRKIKEFQK